MAGRRQLVVKTIDWQLSVGSKFTISNLFVVVSRKTNDFFIVPGFAVIEVPVPAYFCCYPYLTVCRVNKVIGIDRYQWKINEIGQDNYRLKQQV